MYGPLDTQEKSSSDPLCNDNTHKCSATLETHTHTHTMEKQTNKKSNLYSPSQDRRLAVPCYPREARPCPSHGLSMNRMPQMTLYEAISLSALLPSLKNCRKHLPLSTGPIRHDQSILHLSRLALEPEMAGCGHMRDDEPPSPLLPIPYIPSTPDRKRSRGQVQPWSSLSGQAGCWLTEKSQ